MAKKKSGRRGHLRFRHRVVRHLLAWTLGVYTRLKYRVRIRRYEEGKGPFLVLYNHQTAFDQFFVGLSFREPVYYLASEDLFSMGFLSSVIRYLVAPIPIKKQTTDVSAVMSCLRVAREGGTVAIAPEGNRTYSGKTEYINPAIVPLCRKMRLPLLLYRIEGGYGVHPRWADKVRRGRMTAGVARTVSVEEMASLSDAALYELICRELSVDEGNAEARFKGRALAEHLERALYVCPDCGLSRFASKKNEISCLNCGKRSTYLPTRELSGDFPFRFVGAWYDFQCDFINSHDFTSTREPLYTEQVKILRVIPYKKKEPLAARATIALYGDGILLTHGGEASEYPFDALGAVTVLGKNKLDLYTEDGILQIVGDRSFNALKYVHLYHRYKNLKKGDANVKFLGL